MILEKRLDRCAFFQQCLFEALPVFRRFCRAFRGIPHSVLNPRVRPARRFPFRLYRRNFRRSAGIAAPVPSSAAPSAPTGFF
jgi:hypothetical protein